MSKHARRMSLVAVSLSFTGAGVLLTAQPASATAAHSVVDVPYAPGATYNSPLTSGADIDGDGHDDVVVAQGDVIVVHRGDGSGGLSDPISSPFVSVSGGTAWTRVLAAGDVNDDDADDLVVAESIAPNRIQLSLLHSDGESATLGSPTAIGGPIPLIAPVSSTIGDVDGDGHGDLLVTFGAGFAGSSWLLHNNGDGTLADPALLGVTGYAPRLVDLDSDDADDLIGWDATVVSDDQLRAFVADPNTPVQPSSLASLFSADAGTSGRIALVADLTGDDLPDLVTQNGTKGGIAVSMAPGEFATATPLAIGVSNAGASDVDGDGDLDLLALDELGVLTVAVNDGAGAFEPHPLTDLPKGVLIPLDDVQRIAILHDLFGDAPGIAVVTFGPEVTASVRSR